MSPTPGHLLHGSNDEDEEENIAELRAELHQSIIAANGDFTNLKNAIILK